MSLRRKILLVVLGIVLLTPTVVLYYVATTEAGLRFVAARLHDRKVGPVTLTLEGVEGSLADGFRVKALRVQHRLSDVRVEELSGRVRLPQLLLLRRINVADFHVKNADVKLLRDPVQREQRTPRFLPPALRIDVDAGRVDAVTLTLVNGRVLQATGATGGVTILPRQIHVRDAQLDTDEMHLEATGRVLAARPYGLEGDATGTWHPANRPAWKFDTRFDGDLDELPLTLHVAEPLTARVEGKGFTLNKGWRFAGDADVRDVDLSEFGGGTALGILSGQLALTLDANGFTASGPVTPPGLKAGAFQVNFNGAYAERRLVIRSADARHPGSGARATARGTVDVVPNGPVLALNGEWTQFRWPLASSEPAFTSPRGRYVISGTKPWTVRGEGDVIAAGFPVMPATMTGKLDGDSVLIDDATLQLYGGNAQFKGEASWKPAEAWQVAGHMAGFDTALLRADLPGTLEFDFTASGAPFGEAGTIDFSMDGLTGRLRGQNAGGKGDFRRPGGSKDWQFRGVDLRVGRTRVQLDGGLGATRDLAFAVEAEDLSLFDAEARGRISARGRYAGSSEAPLIVLNAHGTKFEWQQYQLDKLDADIDIDLSPNGHARGQMTLTDMKVGARNIQKTTVALSGDGQQQRVALDMTAEPLRGAMTMQGAMQGGLWQGSVQSLTLDDTDDLSLRLETPAALQFNASTLNLSRLCLKGEQEKLCGDARRAEGGAWGTTFSAESLPLRTFTAGLTQDMDYDGTIHLQGELSGSPGALPVGSVRGELNQARLLHRLSNGREERMALGSGTVAASATTDSFDVKVGLDAGASGSIQGSLQGRRNAGDWRDHPVQGTLVARTDALSLLDMFLVDIDKASGQLSTRVNIAGTLGTPQLDGELQLREASIDIYQINLALRALSLDARFDSNALNLTGQSQLGNGMAKFEGRLAWREGQPYGDLKVTGDRLLVVNVPEARIEASPDLGFRVAGRRVEVTGEVRVPSARIEPADLTEAVLPSGDEVLLGAPPVDPDKRWVVVSDIRMVLGDQVQIDSLGLSARLGGAIEVRSDASENSRGQGELNIISGKYAALGRQLDIERGRLIYNNVPLGDPGVDLRAQKVFPDVTAGVNVRGSLRAPRLTFYSEPSIPQSQIASLILAGGSLESVQDSQRPGAARNDLLAQGGAILAQRVGNRVGVDDVGIESDLSNESSLVLGKYLSPRLYVSYGISLAEAINTLKLRYTIGDRWTIKTEAGKARSADIVFTIKKQ